MKTEPSDFAIGDLMYNTVRRYSLLVVGFDVWDPSFGPGCIKVYDPSNGRFEAVPRGFFDSCWDIMEGA